MIDELREQTMAQAPYPRRSQCWGQYVGQTSRDPDWRFDQKKAGYKSSGLVTSDLTISGSTDTSAHWKARQAASERCLINRNCLCLISTRCRHSDALRQTSSTRTGGQLDSFDYLSVLLSIGIGLAITQVLQGLRVLMLSRETARLYAPSLIWAALILL